LWGGEGVGVERFYENVEAASRLMAPLPALPYKGRGN
jgi:hypothetical protein